MRSFHSVRGKNSRAWKSFEVFVGIFYLSRHRNLDNLSVAVTSTTSLLQVNERFLDGKRETQQLHPYQGTSRIIGDKIC